MSHYKQTRCDNTVKLLFEVKVAKYVLPYNKIIMYVFIFFINEQSNFTCILHILVWVDIVCNCCYAACMYCTCKLIQHLPC